MEINTKAQDAEDLNGFLLTEVMHSQRLRCLAMASVYLFISLMFIIAGTLERLPDALLAENWNLPNYYWIIFINLFVGSYELINYFLLKEKNIYSIYFKVFPYSTSFLEAIHPTLIIWILAHTLPVAVSLTAPPVFLYSIVIILSALHINARLCIFTGAVAGFSYLGLAYILSHPLTQSGTSLRVLYFILTGVIASVVTKQIKNSLLKSQTLAFQKDKADAENIAKSKYIADMSHELRTPLTAIIGYSELLSYEASKMDNKQLATNLHSLEDSGKHLMNIINDVLDLAKIEAGKTELYSEEILLSDLIERLRFIATPLALKNKNEFIIKIHNTPETINIDAMHLEQVLINLIGNACKFTKNGKITFIISADQDQITFKIKDTGIGISDPHISLLFDDYHQADQTITKEYGGTGLGLSISRKLINLMNGNISVESIINKGSVFTLKIPITK